MTNAIEASEVLKQLEKISVAVTSIQSDIADIKISQTRTDERFNSIEVQISDLKRNTDTNFADLKLQVRAQDSRLWTFVGALFLSVLGFLAKFAFFPGGQS